MHGVCPALVAAQAEAAGLPLQLADIRRYREAALGASGWGMDTGKRARHDQGRSCKATSRDGFVGCGLMLASAPAGVGARPPSSLHNDALG
jgi:hypothetical protein